MKRFHLFGIGTAVPRHSISQQDAIAAAQQLQYSICDPHKLTKIYGRAGVQTRHSVVLDSSTNGESIQQSFYSPATSHSDQGPSLSQRMQLYERHASQLATGAVRRALAAACMPADEVSHLITISCTGFFSPGVDIQLIDELKLPRNVARTHIGFMGCHGLLNGLRMARSIVLSDPSATVLLCAVELCSLHQQYGDRPDHIVSNALFADGAAAVVGGSAKKCRRDDSHWSLVANESYVIPETTGTMSWIVRDNGFEMSLSAEVPGIIERELRGWMTSWLADHGLCIGDVAQWAVHPGGPRILSAVESALGIRRGGLRESWDVLRDYGNMSSPTIAFVLEKMCPKSRGPCVLLGFGPGLTIEAALLS